MGRAGGDRPEALAVDTRWGTTCGHRWPGDGEPVLFLHGTAGTSAARVPYVPTLGGRDAYAFDTIGDVGRTRQTVEIREPADLAGWLDQSLAGLGLDRVHVVGVSYGGFLGLHAGHPPPGARAVARPARPGRDRAAPPVPLPGLGHGGPARLRAARAPRRAAARALRMPASTTAGSWPVFSASATTGSGCSPPSRCPTTSLRSIAAPVLCWRAPVRGPRRAGAGRPGRGARSPASRPRSSPAPGHALPFSHAALCAARLVGFWPLAAGGQRSKRIAP